MRFLSTLRFPCHAPVLSGDDEFSRPDHNRDRPRVRTPTGSHCACGDKAVADLRLSCKFAREMCVAPISAHSAPASETAGGAERAARRPGGRDPVPARRDSRRHPPCSSASWSTQAFRFRGEADRQLSRATLAITSIASGWSERTLSESAPLSSQARKRSLMRAGGPTNDLRSTHSSGTAAIASFLRPAR